MIWYVRNSSNPRLDVANAVYWKPCRSQSILLDYLANRDWQKEVGSCMFLNRYDFSVSLSIAFCEFQLNRRNTKCGHACFARVSVTNSSRIGDKHEFSAPNVSGYFIKIKAVSNGPIYVNMYMFNLYTYTYTSVYCTTKSMKLATC
jgi:hypothetical protein